MCGGRVKHMDVFNMKKSLEVIEITLSVTWMVGENVFFFQERKHGANTLK